MATKAATMVEQFEDFDRSHPAYSGLPRSASAARAERSRQSVRRHHARRAAIGAVFAEPGEYEVLRGGAKVATVRISVAPRTGQKKVEVTRC